MIKQNTLFLKFAHFQTFKSEYGRLTVFEIKEMLFDFVFKTNIKID